MGYGNVWKPGRDMILQVCDSDTDESLTRMSDGEN